MTKSKTLYIAYDVDDELPVAVEDSYSALARRLGIARCTINYRIHHPDAYYKSNKYDARYIFAVVEVSDDD